MGKNSIIHNRLIPLLLVFCLALTTLTGCGIQSQHLEVTYEDNNNEDIHNWEDADRDSVTTWDQACGTGGMLSTGYNFIKRYNPSADVRLFGQEINPESYAMCLAEMLIKGQNAENICYQDTMKADRFKGTKMRFVLEIIWSFIQAIQDVHDEAHSLLAA